MHQEKKKGNVLTEDSSEEKEGKKRNDSSTDLHLNTLLGVFGGRKGKKNIVP